MEALFDILKIILPALIVFLTTYYLVKNFLNQENQKKMLDLKISNQTLITPIRLQAYERIILFLERINPNSMVMRTNKNVPASVLEAELLKIIRTEFEHNLSQQLYMSKAAWEAVVKAKEETIKLVTVTSTKIHPGTTGMEFAQTFIHVASQLSNLPTKPAIELIKKEVGKEF